MSELRAGAPFVHSELTIVPIESVRRDGFLEEGRFGISAFKEPVAVVLLTHAGVQAVDISGAEVDVESLAAKVPGLREILDAGHPKTR